MDEKDILKEIPDLYEDNGMWRGSQYSFYSHTKCEFFPCHQTEDKENFNCLFCYCPLYALGDKCGGNFKYTYGGIKDCSGCMIPHKLDNYGYIIGRFGELVELTRRQADGEPPEETKENKDGQE